MPGLERSPIAPGVEQAASERPQNHPPELPPSQETPGEVLGSQNIQNALIEGIKASLPQIEQRPGEESTTQIPRERISEHTNPEEHQPMPESHASDEGDKTLISRSLFAEIRQRQQELQRQNSEGGQDQSTRGGDLESLIKGDQRLRLRRQELKQNFKQMEDASNGEQKPDQEQVTDEQADKNLEKDITDELKNSKGDYGTIKRNLESTPRGQEALTVQTTYNVSVKVGEAEDGSFYDHSRNATILDPVLSQDEFAIVFVHEMNHAEYAHTDLSFNSSVGRMPREHYIDGMLHEEMEGQVKAIQHNMQRGSRTPTTLQAEYQKGYKQGRNTLQAKNPAASASELDQAGLLAAKQAVLDGFKNGWVTTSTTKQTYEVFYGNAWDDARAQYEAQRK